MRNGWRPGLLFVALCFCAVLGCTKESAPTDCEGVGQSKLSWCYFSSWQSVDGVECPGPDGGLSIDNRLRIQLFYGGRLVDLNVVEWTRALQRFYAPYDLTFEMVGPPKSIDIDTALSLNSKELLQDYSDAGLPEDQNSWNTTQREKAGELFNKHVTRSLTKLIIDNSAGPQQINLVIVEEYANRELNDLLPAGPFTGGIGLSPTLFDRIAVDDPKANYYRLFSLPKSFTPTLVVFHLAMKRFTANPDFLVAHELGHALGLPHDEVSGTTNLMWPDAGGLCKYLTSGQIGDMVGFSSN